MESRERAYRAFRAAGDNGAAARVAAWLAADYREFRGEGSVGRGWLQRAHSAIAASEDLQLPVSAGWALCCLISACDGVGDFPRAAQWCKTMREFTDRWGGRQILGICRSAYGRVLATGGDWPAAEAELTAAVADLSASRPGIASGGLVRLGEHRARQGRTGEARELFEQAGPAGFVGLGQLALDGGDARGAADIAERVLRALPEDVLLERLPALELLARAVAALSDRAQGGGRPGDGPASDSLARADAASAELQVIAERLDMPYLRARARLVAGELATARGEHDAARQACEDAVDCFMKSSAPYEGAVARLELAGALAALGQAERAAAERRAATEVFERLGARRDLERAEAPAASATGELSPRELEVLALVAQGLSDAEIAERLVVSPHTVHRHVANVRAKLRLPSRSAAVAYAAREGLL
jgi:DNA-binding NarL/FixJ family response regulator